MLSSRASQILAISTQAMSYMHSKLTLWGFTVCQVRKGKEAGGSQTSGRYPAINSVVNATREVCAKSVRKPGGGTCKIFRGAQRMEYINWGNRSYKKLQGWETSLKSISFICTVTLADWKTVILSTGNWNGRGLEHWGPKCWPQPGIRRPAGSKQVFLFIRPVHLKSQI